MRSRIESHSTDDEAEAILPELRRQGVQTFLLVTSDYHTRRAGGIYRAWRRICHFIVVAAPDRYFSAQAGGKIAKGAEDFRDRMDENASRSGWAYETELPFSAPLSAAIPRAGSRSGWRR